MGADLYIKKLQNKCEAKWKPLFDTYCQERNRLQALQKNGVQIEQSRIDAAQKKVDKAYDGMYAEGYFRDSYNGTNVLWRLGLSYWEDFPKYMNGKSEIEGEKLKQLRDIIASNKLKPITKAELKKQHCTVDDGENSVEAWQKMFERKHKELVKLFDTAIKLKTSIYCSV